MRPIVRATGNYRRLLRSPADRGGFWMRRDIEPFVPTSTAIGETLPAVVNDGRWVVQCPNCGSAQLVEPGDDKFLCVECANDYLGQQWVSVVWPDRLEEIEAALSVRDHPVEMNWQPGETVEDLQAENKANGVT